MSSVTNFSIRTPWFVILVMNATALFAEGKTESKPTSKATSPKTATTLMPPDSKGEAAKAPLQKTSATVAPANTVLLDSCKRVFQKFAVPYQELWKKHGPDLRSEETDGYDLIADLNSDYCTDDDHRRELIEFIAKVMNTHSGKIGVVLPIAKNNYLRHLIAGFEANLTAHHLDPKSTLVMIDTQGKDERVHQAISSFVFQHKVSAIIGGTDPNEAAILKYWAPKLSIPTFIVSEPSPGPATSFVFYAHPSQKSLAKAATDANIRYGHRRVSILSPQDQHSDQFIKSYEEAAKNAGITVTGKIPYDSKNYESMEAAARKMFRLDTSDRREELTKLYETAKLHAKESNTKFNPKMVALQPDIQQDAMLIPDNFRIVRHFSKIFGYLGVRKLPLFGHFEWRSKGLISPWDHFMNGSYFVDFQGSYANMPGPIKIKPLESPYFVAPDQVEQSDFSLIGWRAIEWPIRLSQQRKELRRKLDKIVARKVTSKIDIIYDDDQNLIWNSSIFLVTESSYSSGQLTIVNP